MAALMASICLLMLTAIPTTAQNGTAPDNADAVISDFLNVYNFTAKKVGDLANAIPTDKYEWSPGEGVRSIKETVLHVASSNYFFGSQLGMEIPEGVDMQGMEKSDMSKEEAIKALKESVDFANKAVKNVPTEEMSAELNLFGQTFSKRQLIFILGDHVAEHLGQLIAYARMNEVTPPWSMSQGQ